jgi:Holliday junction resolvase
MMIEKLMKGKKKNSNRKGKVGEREWANYCKFQGFEESRRSQQHCGTADSADVIGLDFIHQEVKREERLNVVEAMKKVIKDAEGSGNIPIIAHRKNGEKWLVTMRADDWFKLYKEWLNK